MELETGLVMMPELLWNVEGVVLVHGVTYRNSWLFVAERVGCASENGRRLVGGVKPVWCKRIGQKAERGDPEWAIRPHGEICDVPLVSREPRLVGKHIRTRLLT